MRFCIKTNKKFSRVNARGIPRSKYSVGCSVSEGGGGGTPVLSWLGGGGTPVLARGYPRTGVPPGKGPGTGVAIFLERTWLEVLWGGDGINSPPPPPGSKLTNKIELLPSVIIWIRTVIILYTCAL